MGWTDMGGIFSHQGLLGNKLNGRALQIGVCVTGSTGFMLLGYDQGVMSGILTEPLFLSTFPQMAPKNKSGAIQSLVVAIYEIGCLFGAIGIIWFGDKIGRRRSILLGTSIMIVGAIIQTSSFGLAQLIIGRIVTGIGNGMNTSTIPVYQSEIAPPNIRGFLVLFEGALITLGIVIAYWLNYGFWFVTMYGSFQWRFPIGFQVTFAVGLILGVLLFPESPRWLLKHGKVQEAEIIMGRLEDAAPDSEQIQNDIKEIQAINHEEAKGLSWKEFFRNDSKAMNAWRAWAGIASQAFQQLSGINLVTYYATTVFEDSLQFTPALSRFMTGWLGTEYFLAAVVALFVVDRLGRRNLMMWGAAGMAVSLLIIGASLSNGSKKGALAATVFIFVYDTFFALGWLGVTWLYPAEVTPIRIRAQAAGLSTCSNWLFNYGVVQLAPIMINKIAWKTYFVFFCLNIAFVPAIYFFFPETNGHKLETLDAIFAEAHEKGENPVWTERAYRKGKRTGLEDEENGNENGSGSEEEKEKIDDGDVERREEI